MDQQLLNQLNGIASAAGGGSMGGVGIGASPMAMMAMASRVAEQEDDTNWFLVIIVGICLLVVLGVGGYFIWKYSFVKRG
jgi:heme/copper-type cytochrome/quinol oxidase subunit 2